VNAAAARAASATIDPMIDIAGAALAVLLLDGPTPPRHFTVTASYNPPRRKGPAEVAVQFVALDPEVKINEVPAPQLGADDLGAFGSGGAGGIERVGGHSYCSRKRRTM
jgi:hypothetical protein